MGLSKRTLPPTPAVGHQVAVVTDEKIRDRVVAVEDDLDTGDPPVATANQAPKQIESLRHNQVSGRVWGHLRQKKLRRRFAIRAGVGEEATRELA